MVPHDISPCFRIEALHGFAIVDSGATRSMSGVQEVTFAQEKARTAHGFDSVEMHETTRMMFTFAPNMKEVSLALAGGTTAFSAVYVGARTLSGPAGALKISKPSECVSRVFADGHHDLLTRLKSGRWGFPPLWRERQQGMTAEPLTVLGSRSCPPRSSLACKHIVCAEVSCVAVCEASPDVTIAASSMKHACPEFLSSCEFSCDVIQWNVRQTGSLWSQGVVWWATLTTAVPSSANENSSSSMERPAFSSTTSAMTLPSVREVQDNTLSQGLELFADSIT